MHIYQANHSYSHLFDIIIIGFRGKTISKVIPSFLQKCPSWAYKCFWITSKLSRLYILCLQPFFVPVRVLNAITENLSNNEHCIKGGTCDILFEIVCTTIDDTCKAESTHLHPINMKYKLRMFYAYDRPSANNFKLAYFEVCLKAT